MAVLVLLAASARAGVIAADMPVGLDGAFGLLLAVGAQVRAAGAHAVSSKKALKYMSHILWRQIGGCIGNTGIHGAIVFPRPDGYRALPMVQRIAQQVGKNPHGATCIRPHRAKPLGQIHLHDSIVVGQLNIITADYGAVNSVSSSLVPEKVKLDFKQIPTGMNLLDGTLTVNDDVVSGPVDVAEVTDPVQADGAKQLSFDYIFAPETEQKMLSGIKMTFCDENGSELSVTPYEFPDIPLQRNYRTNVSGNLLTKTGTLTVEVNADFEGTLVSTPDELMDVFKTGGSVRLSKDIELTGTGDDVILIGGGSQVQIDLGGKNRTLNGNTLSASDGASLSLTNGAVTGSNLPANKLLVFAASDGTVLLDGVKMESDGAGVGLNEKCDNGRLEIRNSTINALSFAVGTNASTPVYESNTIVIDNSTLTAWSAVLFNIPGTLEITDSKITGTNHGVILRGGTATIRNSILSIAYNEGNASSDSEYMHNQDWGGGNAVPYAALTVGNRGSGYQYPSVLTLKDCTLQSIEGAAGEENNPGLFPVMYVYANSGKDLGVTITYDDNTKFTGGKGIVYGRFVNVTVNGKVPDNN